MLTNVTSTVVTSTMAQYLEAMSMTWNNELSQSFACSSVTSLRTFNRNLELHVPAFHILTESVYYLATMGTLIDSIDM